MIPRLPASFASREKRGDVFIKSTIPTVYCTYYTFVSLIQENKPTATPDHDQILHRNMHRGWRVSIVHARACLQR